mmetsp:Transcript_29626/g.43692  ORF Transcript_29626/g.43692 Transcript_29626/m.43692 type:complete len:97 (+) Transcript_29626:525-815(+)
MIARAIATRWRCPPERSDPDVPISVLYPCSRPEMNPCAFAALHAAVISSSVASGLPSKMLSLIVPLNSTGFCPTYPICFRSQVIFSSLTSFPSIRT